MIDGAAGFGYTLTEEPVFPSQSFSRIEIETLVLGIGSLETLGALFWRRWAVTLSPGLSRRFPMVRPRQAMYTILRACWDETSLWILYRDLRDRCTERENRPLGLSYSPGALMLLAHCQPRQDYRVFHIDRITELRAGDNSFRPRRVVLRTYVASLNCRGTSVTRAAGRHSASIATAFAVFIADAGPNVCADCCL